MACCDAFTSCSRVPASVSARSDSRTRTPGLVDPHLLLVVGIFQPRQQRALLHLLALLDRQLDDAPLHLEAHQALVRFNVAGERELVRGRRLLRQARIEIHAGGNRRGQQNHNRNQVVS
jgi:hypothetical protein